MAEWFGSDLVQLLSRPFRDSGPGTLRLPVSLYGKLPIYKDFIRKGLADPASQAFKLWLDNGVSRFWESDPACRGVKMEPHVFFVRFPGTGRSLLGYIWGSGDQGDLRHFPFSYFVSLPTGRSGLDLRTAMGAFEDVRRAGEKFRREIAFIPNIEAFYQQFREPSLELTFLEVGTSPEPLPADFDTLSVAHFASSLYGNRWPEEWSALLSFLRRALAARSRSGGSALAIRLPFSPQLAVGAQVSIWLEMFERFESGSARSLQILLATHPEKAGIVLISRDLRSDDIFGFNSAKSDHDHIEDLRTTVPKGSPPPSPLPESETSRPLRSLLSTGGRTTRD